MSTLVSVAFALKILAVLLLVVTAVAVFLAGRLDLRLKQKYWSGDRIGGAEHDRARTRILALRVGAGACLAVAVMALIAAVTLQAYQGI